MRTVPTPAPAPAAASTPSTTPVSTPRASRADRFEHRQRGDEFERLLRRKSSDRDGDDGEPAGTPAAADGAPPASASTPTLPAPTPTPTPATNAARAATPGDGAAAPAGTRGAEPPAPSLTVAAMQRADAAPIAAPTMHRDAGGAWEVSLRDPLGIAVELRATRAATAGPGAAPGPWTLSVAAPGITAAILSQQAPRLSERLQERLRGKAIGEFQLRIERGGRDRHEREDDPGESP